MVLHFYATDKQNLYITEFGHSHLNAAKEITPRHRWDYLLHIVVSGTGEFIGEPVHGGEAFLIAKNKRHMFTLADGYEHYWFGFDGEKINQLLSALDIDGEEHGVYDISNFDQVLSVLRKSFSSYVDSSDDSQSLAALLYILPHLHLRNRADALHQTDYVHWAQNFIDRNVHRSVSIDEVSQSVHISSKHLCRLFNKELGISPQRYIIQAKMRRALQLLQDDNISVKEVAVSVGYDSQLAFSTAFRKEYGLCPSKMRKLDTDLN